MLSSCRQWSIEAPGPSSPTIGSGARSAYPVGRLFWTTTRGTERQPECLLRPRVSVSARTSHLVDFGIPVKVGGVWINPGDLLHGDHHGVVLIPHEIAERIHEAGERVGAEEQQIIQACRPEGFTVERLKATYKAVRPDAY